MTAGDVRRPQDGVRVVLIGKPGCHLCDIARDVVRRVTDELGLEWDEMSILDHPELAERYAERIPVVLVDGRPHDYWRVDARRLRRSLSPPTVRRRLCAFVHKSLRLSRWFGSRRRSAIDDKETAPQ